MTLADFLSSRDLTYAAFGALGGWSDETVRMWAIGKRMPRRPHMARITEVTDGQVQPSDFYDQNAPSATEAA